MAVIKIDHMETPGLGPFVTVTMEMELRVGMGLSWSLSISRAITRSFWWL